VKKPQSVKQVISSRNSGLKNLLHKSSKLDRLNQELAQQLPPPLSQHCTIASIENETLTLIVDSPVWASRARFQTQNIIRGMTKFNVKSVNIKTKLAFNSPQPPKKHQTKMSAETSNLLIQLANTSSTPKLKQALLRLSRRASK